MRTFLIVLGAALICVACYLFISGNAAWPTGFPILVFGFILLLGTLFDRRYRTQTPKGGAWQKTGERFLDPATGKMVDVLYNPATGERSYQDIEAPGKG